MKYPALNVPINSVSFGQVSVAILREFYKRKLQPNIFPIGQVDLSAQNSDEEFNRWLGGAINNAQRYHCRKDSSIRLWHINDSLHSFSETDAQLITFHECDSLTPWEINILKNQDKIWVTNKFTQQNFSTFGIESHYLPLGFDGDNFRLLEKRPKIENVIQFSVFGKLEARKGHFKVLKAWAKKYGNNKKYRLNTALHNPFLKPEHQEGLINHALEGKSYWNINRIPYCATNAQYNIFLQSSEIAICMSGGEGRDLGAYHATALGAWPVALKAHAYLDYLNQENAVLVNPNGKRPAADGIFFGNGGNFNQGNFFDFDEDEFIAACEIAETKTANGINQNGLKLQNLTYKNTVDTLLGI